MSPEVHEAIEAALEKHRQSFDLVALDAARKIDELFGARFRSNNDVRRRARVQCLILDLLAEHTAAEGDGWLPIESYTGKNLDNCLIAGKYPNGIPYVEESFRRHAGHWNGRKLDPPTHYRPLPPPPSAGAKEGER